MILIKNKQILKVLLEKSYASLLIELILDVLSITTNIVVTEGWREGKGVHSTIPCRAIDLRFWIYSYKELQKIMREINNRWVYDPQRPTMECMILHDTGGGIHIHLQVHPNTRRIE